MRNLDLFAIWHGRHDVHNSIGSTQHTTLSTMLNGVKDGRCNWQNLSSMLTTTRDGVKYYGTCIYTVSTEVQTAMYFI